jgi:hypothetical protein
MVAERRRLLVFTCGVLSILAYYSGILDSATGTLAARRRLSLESALFSDGFASSSLVLEEHTLMSASPLLLRSRAATATTTTAGEGTAGSSSISSAVACADVLRADRAATEGDAQSRLFDAVFAADDPSEVRRRSWKRGNVQRPGGAPSVWPAPRSTRRGGRHVRRWRAAELAPAAFRFVPRFEAAAAAQSPTLRAVLRRAHERYCRLIFGDGALKHGATAAAQSSSSTAQLAALHVVINASSSAWPRLNMSEAYSLRVDGAEATLRAPWAERIAPPIAPPAASAAGAAGAAGAEEIGSGVARWLDMDVVDTTFMQVVEWSTHPYAHVHAHAHAHAHAHYAHAGGAARGRPRGRGEPQAAARALCDQPAHGRRPVRAARHTSYRAAAP